MRCHERDYTQTFFGVTEREVGMKGRKKEKGVEGKFSLRVICQNHNTISLMKGKKTIDAHYSS